MDRHELAQRVVRMLPELVVRRIGELAGVEHVKQDVEVIDPLRIDVSLTREQFLNAVLDGSASDPERIAAVQPVVSQIDAAVRQSVLPELQNRPVEAADEQRSGRVPSATDEIDSNDISDSQDAPPGHAEPFAGSSLIRMLIGHRQDDRLGPFLRRLSVSTLVAWHDNLLRVTHLPVRAAAHETRGESTTSPFDGRQGSGDNQTSSRRIIEQFAKTLPANDHDPAIVLRYRIAAAVEVALQTGVAPGTQHVMAELDSFLPIPRPTRDGARGRPSLDADAGTPTTAGSPTGESSNRSLLRRLPSVPDDGGPGNPHSPPSDHPVDNERRTSQQRERLPPRPTESDRIHIPSALPFLILGPLADIGFLECVAASLEAAGCAELAPAFGAALAYKVLDPPERGWRRRADERRAAAAVAGFADDVSDDRLLELASYEDQFVSPLNAVTSQAVLAGHETDQPLFVSRIDDPDCTEFLLADAQGLFPVGFASDEIELVELVDCSEPSMVLVDATAASPSLLRQLHQRGQRFVMNVPPVRGEKWRSIRDHQRGRWWTNDAVTPEPRIAHQAARLDDTADAAAGFQQAIRTARPAVPNACGQPLERTLTLASGVGLAQIAWDLWRDREATDPVLTLERFGDLDAHVQFTDDEVRVRLPLGRRSTDLLDHGLLRDLTGVPWLGRRVVKFSRG